MKKILVCKNSELTEAEPKAVKILTRQIAVFRVNGEVFAYDGLCKHMRAPLAVSGRRSGLILTCSWHGWQYNLSDGSCVGKPGVRLRRYDVEIANDLIYVIDDPEVPGA